MDPVSQAIDVWSLGCVFSLVATWVVLGYRQGIQTFDQVRQRNLRDLTRENEARVRAENETPKSSAPMEGNHWHNGKEVLLSVTQWHDYLRKTMRPSDPITSSVLDLVDDRMLLAKPEDRIKVDELCRELQLILDKSASDEKPLPDLIQSLLGEIDQDDSFSNSNLQHSRDKLQEESSSDRTTVPAIRASPRHERSLKTSHRQSMWPNQDLRKQDGVYPETRGLKLETIAEQRQTPEVVPHTPQRRNEPQLQVTLNSVMSQSITHSEIPSMKKKYSYFQAKEKIIQLSLQ